MYIDRRSDRITIEHTNDLPKYRCEYPDQAKRVAQYFDNSKYITVWKGVEVVSGNVELSKRLE